MTNKRNGNGNGSSNGQAQNNGAKSVKDYRVFLKYAGYPNEPVVKFASAAEARAFAYGFWQGSLIQEEVTTYAYLHVDGTLSPIGEFGPDDEPNEQEAAFHKAHFLLEQS